jgi:hypothetical protein
MFLPHTPTNSTEVVSSRHWPPSLYPSGRIKLLRRACNGCHVYAWGQCFGTHGAISSPSDARLPKEGLWFVTSLRYLL